MAMGWPRPKEIPAWDSLTADQRKVYARIMEVYAAATAQSDHEIGRILDALQDDRTPLYMTVKSWLNTMLGIDR